VDVRDWYDKGGISHGVACVGRYEVALGVTGEESQGFQTHIAPEEMYSPGGCTYGQVSRFTGFPRQTRDVFRW